MTDDILNKTGANLSGTDLYRIVSAAMHETNLKIDKLDKDIQNKVTLLENRVNMLEAEGEKKDEDIERLKHTVVNMQRALSSIDQDQRSINDHIRFDRRCDKRSWRPRPSRGIIGRRFIQSQTYQQNYGK